MELSMYTTYALGQNFPSETEAFLHFYDKGVRYGDIVDTELEKIPLPLYCKYLRNAGITPGSVVSMLDIASFDEKTRKENMARLKAIADEMAEEKINLLMPAPSVREARSEAEFQKMRELLIEAFSEIEEYARGMGIKTAIENQSSLVRADSRGADVKYILDAVPNLGFVFDVGNFFCIGEDARESYKLLRDRLVHVHVKDWEFNPYGRFVRENMPRFEGVAIGDGVLPLREIFETLKKDNYTGRAVLEINAGNITLHMLDKSAEFLKNYI